MDIDLFKELISYTYEKEWLEFKTNWSNRDDIGEYISALANVAALKRVNYAYMFWGVEDKTHKIVGTVFDYDEEEKGEPLKHYISRQLTPSINYEFESFEYESKRIVCLTIPASKLIPTEYMRERYIRIGSSKESLRKYPHVESDLWAILRNTNYNIINQESPKQNLEFNKLLVYYMSKGLRLKESTFKDELNFYVPNTKRYNILAYLMADENNITMRVSIFSGVRKSDNLYSVKDFGNQCILYTIDKVLEYLDVINILQADETNRVVERKEVSLFDSKALREAVLNAFIHNDWLDLNAPMISVFTDRIDILSYGSLPEGQTLEGFYEGKSEPRSKELAHIFLQLRISERSGRGVNKIIDAYGKEAFLIEDNFIKVTIKYNRVKKENKIVNIENDKRKSRIIDTKSKILFEMRDNPNVTTSQLINETGLTKTTIQKYIRLLKDENRIERIGSNKDGYWKVID